MGDMLSVIWHGLPLDLATSAYVSAPLWLALTASIWLGDLPVFLITSVLAACFDLSFVLIQRYNRPTVIRLAQRQKRRAGTAR